MCVKCHPILACAVCIRNVSYRFYDIFRFKKVSSWQIVLLRRKVLSLMSLYRTGQDDLGRHSTHMPKPPFSQRAVHINI
jgi:hypothetical protein